MTLGLETTWDLGLPEDLTSGPPNSQTPKLITGPLTLGPIPLQNMISLFGFFCCFSRLLVNPVSVYRILVCFLLPRTNKNKKAAAPQKNDEVRGTLGGYKS